VARDCWYPRANLSRDETGTVPLPSAPGQKGGHDSDAPAHVIAAFMDASFDTLKVHVSTVCLVAATER